MTEHTCKLAPMTEETPIGLDEPTLGLSPVEKKLLADSWQLVQKDLTGNGIVILLNYFTDYSHNMKYFPFRDTPIEELGKEPLLKLHAQRVMRELSSIVNNMQKPETVLHALKQNALNHRKRKINAQAYDEMRASLVKSMAEQLGPEVFTDVARATWDKALRIILDAIVQVINDGKCYCPK